MVDICFREVGECVISSLWALPVCSDGEGNTEKMRRKQLMSFAFQIHANVIMSINDAFWQ